MTTIEKFHMSAIAAGLLFLGACGGGDNDEIDYPSKPEITIDTPQASEPDDDNCITITTGFSVKGDAAGLKAGYAVGDKPDPTIYNSVYDATISGNTMKATISNLSPSSEYHVRAFLKCKDDLTYSKDIVIKTGKGSAEDQLANYRGPSYPDYYISIAGWENRAKWNLSNVHDPSVVKAADGYYYMYQTDASYGNAHSAGGHFHGRRSKDLVNWEYLGGTMKTLPKWVVPKLNEIRKEMGLKDADPDLNAFGYWAPCVVKVNDNLYRMYYSIVSPGNINGNNSWTERAFIGMMENTDPANNDGWEDKGFVITNASDRGLNFNVQPTNWGQCYFKFNAIDPSVTVTETGELWMIYGSWHSGIAAVKLDPTTGKPESELGKPFGKDADISAYGKLIATRQKGNRWQGSEGPEVVYRNGYYYLFLAYDELSVAYNTRVVRSKNIDGPYVDINGVNVTDNGGDALPVVTHPYKFNNSPGWVGISHCTVFNDGEDNWYYSSQARFPANYDGNAYSNAVMLGHVRSIVWTKDGWPLVMPERYGAVPQLPVSEKELIGNWEHIDLSYSYGKMKTSLKMTLSSDHKVAEGNWKGSNWSYDPVSQILTINGVELYVRRECDWEDASRRATIVYAGVTNRTTFWGKKSL